MPLELSDEHIAKLSNLAANYFVENFYNEKLNIKKFIQKFDETVRIFQGQVSSNSQKFWNIKIEQDENPNKKRPYDIDYYMMRGLGHDPGEGYIKNLIPEEKIIINKTVFNEKISKINYSNTTPEIEEKVIKDLIDESIGLTDKEVNLYYNLIKLEHLKDSVEKENIEIDTGGGSAEKYYQKIVDLVDKNLCSIGNLKNINDGKPLDYEIISNIVKDKIQRKKLIPEVLVIIAGGSQNQKPLQIIKSFIAMVSNKWGTDKEEALNYLSAYILLNGGRDTLLDKLKLSVVLKKFIEGESIRLKPIIYATLQFVYIFAYLLTSQAYEINKKYKNSTKDQQQKLIKLYNSQERLKMLITAAANFGFQKISNFKSESVETIKNFKLFMQKTQLLSSQDIFYSDYSNL